MRFEESVELEDCLLELQDFLLSALVHMLRDKLHR